LLYEEVKAIERISIYTIKAKRERKSSLGYKNPIIRRLK